MKNLINNIIIPVNAGGIRYRAISSKENEITLFPSDEDLVVKDGISLTFTSPLTSTGNVNIVLQEKSYQLLKDGGVHLVADDIKNNNSYTIILNNGSFSISGTLKDEKIIKEFNEKLEMKVDKKIFGNEITTISTELTNKLKEYNDFSIDSKKEILKKVDILEDELKKSFDELLKKKLDINADSVNSHKLGGLTKEEIIAKSKEGLSVVNHNHDDRYDTKNVIREKLEQKSGVNHIHDELYHRKKEIDSKLSGKANALHNHNDIYYTKNEIDLPTIHRRYTKVITINGDKNTYYPVAIPLGAIPKQQICCWRSYSETAPDSWNTPTHKGGLILNLDIALGGWGGMQYHISGNVAQTYSKILGNVMCPGPATDVLVLLLRGGGAVYTIESEVPINPSIHLGKFDNTHQSYPGGVDPITIPMGIFNSIDLNFTFDSQPRYRLPDYTNLGGLAYENVVTGKINEGTLNVKGKIIVNDEEVLTTNKLSNFVKKDESYFSQLPIGSVIAFAGMDIPAGWLIADGREISEKDYPELYKIMPKGKEQYLKKYAKNQVPVFTNNNPINGFSISCSGEYSGDFQKWKAFNPQNNSTIDSWVGNNGWADSTIDINYPKPISVTRVEIHGRKQEEVNNPKYRMAIGGFRNGMWENIYEDNVERISWGGMLYAVEIPYTGKTYTSLRVAFHNTDKVAYPPPVGYLAFLTLTEEELEKAPVSLIDLRGAFIRGFDDLRGLDEDSGLRDLCSSQIDSFKSHRHAHGYGTIRGYERDGNRPFVNGVSPKEPGHNGFGFANWQTDIVYPNTHDCGGYETRPHNVALNYIVKAKNIFVSVEQTKIEAINILSDKLTKTIKTVSALTDETVNKVNKKIDEYKITKIKKLLWEGNLGSGNFRINTSFLEFDELEFWGSADSNDALQISTVPKDALLWSRNFGGGVYFNGVGGLYWRANIAGDNTTFICTSENSVLRKVYGINYK